MNLSRLIIIDFGIATKYLLPSGKHIEKTESDRFKGSMILRAKMYFIFGRVAAGTI